jgi:hypothetical protein
MKRLTHRALIALFALIGFTSVALAADAAPPATGWSLGEVMALIALILGGTGMLVDAARAILHFTAPRTATTLDDRAAARLDAAHDKIAKLEAVVAGVVPPPPLPVAPQAAKAVIPLAPVLALLCVVAMSCGGSQTSRASTISSLDTGIQTASAALRSYEHQRADGIVALAPDRATGVAQLAALRAKADKVWLALDAARAAIDAAHTINDDPSVAGARTALNNAIDAVTKLTGGTP